MSSYLESCTALHYSYVSGAGTQQGMLHSRIINDDDGNKECMGVSASDRGRGGWTLYTAWQYATANCRERETE